MSSNLEKELNPKTIGFATTVNKSSKYQEDKLFSILDNKDSTYLNIDVDKFNPFKLSEQDEITPKKLTFFRKLVNFFQNNNFLKKISPMTEEDILHLKVKNKVISLIKTEDWTNLDKVIKAGFIITPHIQSMIDEKIENKYLIRRDFDFSSRDKEEEIKKIGEFIFKYGVTPSFISKNIIMKEILNFTQIFDVWYHEKERGWLGTQNYNVFLKSIVDVTKNKSNPSFQILGKLFYNSSLKFTKKNIELSHLVNNFLIQNKEEFVVYFLSSLRKTIPYLKTNGEIGQTDHDDLKLIIHPYNVIIKNIEKDLPPLLLKKVHDDFKWYLNEYRKKRTAKNSYLSIAQELVEEVEKILEELQSVLGDEISDVKEILDLTTQLYGGSKTTQTNSFVIQEVFSIESLPSDIKELYETIKEKSIFIMNNQKEINSEDIFFTQKIVKERIPKIIQKFMLFDDDDLKTMKNADGKSPQEICIETLEGIDTKFQYIIDTLKENNLKDLSAINRYVKKM